MFILCNNKDMVKKLIQQGLKFVMGEKGLKYKPAIVGNDESMTMWEEAGWPSCHSSWRFSSLNFVSVAIITLLASRKGLLPLY